MCSANGSSPQVTSRVNSCLVNASTGEEEGGGREDVGEEEEDDEPLPALNRGTSNIGIGRK